MKALKTKMSAPTMDCMIQIVQEINRHDKTDDDLLPLYTMLRLIRSDEVDVSTALRGVIGQTGNFGCCMLTGIIDSLWSYAKKEGAINDNVMREVVAELSRYFSRRVRVKGKDWAERELAKYFLETVRRRLMASTDSPFSKEPQLAQITALTRPLRAKLLPPGIKTNANC